MELWNGDNFVEAISRKNNIEPNLLSSGEWGNVTAVHWHIPASQFETKAINQYLFGLHTNTNSQLEYRINGSRGRKAHLHSTMFGFVPAGRSINWTLRQSATLMTAFLPPEYLQQACNALGEDYDSVLSGPELFGVHDMHVGHLGTILYDALKNPSDNNKLYLESLLLALSSRLVTVQRGIKPAAHEERAKGALTRRQIQRVFDFMRDNLENDIGLNNISTVLGISEFHFARSFKQSVGMPPHRYLTQMRIEQAMSLLRTSRLPIAEIAVAVGMGTQSQFTHTFRRVAGMPPAEYRKQSAGSYS